MLTNPLGQGLEREKIGSSLEKSYSGSFLCTSFVLVPNLQIGNPEVEALASPKLPQIHRLNLLGLFPCTRCYLYSNCSTQNLSLTCQTIMFTCHIFPKYFIFQYRRFGQIIPAFRYFRN